MAAISGAAEARNAHFFTRGLAEADPEIAAAINHELHRQQDNIELIASENIVSKAVLEAQGSVLTNKYAEGYPGRRYYGGCEYVDVAEELAIDRAKRLFGCEFANVQPHSGAQANQAVFFTLLQPGDAFMGLSLDAGGSFGARLGRSRWGLPYHHSAMKVRRRGSLIRYDCERLWPGKMGVGGRVEAEIGDLYCGLQRGVEGGRVVPGSLEHFLIERYIMYVQKGDELLCGHVHHVPYPLREAKVTFAEQTFLSDLGLHCDRPPDHVLFSEGVSVEVFSLRSILGEA